MNKKANALIIVLIVLGVIALIVLMIFGWIAGTYNTLVQNDVSVKNQWGKVQSAYERRLDLIPNLVSTVKGAAKFEIDTQTQIASLRSGLTNAKSTNDLDKVGKSMNGLISNLIVSVEAYPDLKATQNFLGLQDELAGTENRIKFERDNYNNVVNNYQVSTRVFPSNLIAGMFGFYPDKYSMFQASEEAQNPVKVSF